MFTRITVIMFDSFMLIVFMTFQVRNIRAFGAALFAIKFIALMFYLSFIRALLKLLAVEDT